MGFLTPGMRIAFLIAIMLLGLQLLQVDEEVVRKTSKPCTSLEKSQAVIKQDRNPYRTYRRIDYKRERDDRESTED